MAEEEKEKNIISDGQNTAASTETSAGPADDLGWAMDYYNPDWDEQYMSSAKEERNDDSRDFDWTSGLLDPDAMTAEVSEDIADSIGSKVSLAAGTSDDVIISGGKAVSLNPDEFGDENDETTFIPKERVLDAAAASIFDEPDAPDDKTMVNNPMMSEYPVEGKVLDPRSVMDSGNTVVFAGAAALEKSSEKADGNTVVFANTVTRKAASKKTAKKTAEKAEENTVVFGADTLRNFDAVGRNESDAYAEEDTDPDYIYMEDYDSDNESGSGWENSFSDSAESDSDYGSKSDGNLQRAEVYDDSLVYGKGVHRILLERGYYIDERGKKKKLKKLRRKGPFGVILFALVVFICVAVFYESIQIFNDVPVDSENTKTYEITVDDNSTNAEVGELLLSKNLINDLTIYKIRCLLFDADYVSGTYELSPSYSTEKIINILSGQKYDTDED